MNSIQFLYISPSELAVLKWSKKLLTLSRASFSVFLPSAQTRGPLSSTETRTRNLLPSPKKSTLLFLARFLWASHFPSSDPYPLVAACTFTVDWHEAQSTEGEVWLCISPTSSFSYHPQSLTQPGFTTPTDNTCSINRSCWQKAILSIVCLFKTLNSSQHKEAVVC